MTIESTSLRAAVHRLAGATIALVTLLPGCATESPAYNDQQTFEDPASAVESLLAAARNDDVAELEKIFGPDGHEVLSSGDPVQDRDHREVFVVAMDQGWSLETAGQDVRELIVGDEQWPFPIPLVEDKRGWWFDTAAGAQEILARRVGRNELAVIDVLRIYALAQQEYAAEGHDGRPSGRYAQRIRSSSGMHDGLYWTTDPGDPPSPLSALAAGAAAEGYTEGSGDGPTPFHGYYFRILTRQGAHAPGGAKSYVVDGSMTGGFAAIAWPAEYRNSGVMTFMVGPDGIVYEADLGADTAKAAAAIDAFDPDDRWSPV